MTAIRSSDLAPTLRVEPKRYGPTSDEIRRELLALRARVRSLAEQRARADADRFTQELRKVTEDAARAMDVACKDRRVLAGIHHRLIRRVNADLLRAREDDALRAVADELRSTGALGVELAGRISRRVYEHLEYRWGVTAVTTTAAEAWAGGIGVCQDYAHCMLALCRLCGLPARYVSGHVLGDGGTHAWVEVLVQHPQDEEALRAVPIDPTHDRRAGLRYLTVAVGRDYCDVPPTSGTYDAPYTGELTTHKRAAVTRVEYVRAPRRRRPGPVRTA